MDWEWVGKGWKEERSGDGAIRVGREQPFSELGSLYSSDSGLWCCFVFTYPQNKQTIPIIQNVGEIQDGIHTVTDGPNCNTKATITN